MIDIKFITENPEKIRDGLIKKNSSVDLNRILKLAEERKVILQKIENLRARQNEVSKLINQRTEKDSILKEMSQVKEELKILEPQISILEQELEELVLQVPNLALSSVPTGKDENANQIVSTYGQKPEFSFSPKDHIQLGKELDIIDIERGAKASGSRFYYLKNDGALLEFALLQFVMNKLTAHGFSPIIPPVLVKEEAMIATGFFPADRNEIYSVNPGEDNLFLVGTSEVPLTMLHADEILEESELPKRYCAFSSCFRREAGSYGKDTTGIIRVHQFDKIEMFSFCHPEKSEEEHEFIREIEEEIMRDLGFHYQVVNICSGDLGAPAAKKYDIEVWIPTQNKFRELTSCSNCTDFQARRAKIRYKSHEGNKYTHTLNGTACSMARPIVAILENFQEADGSITIPPVLRPFMGNREKIMKA